MRLDKVFYLVLTTVCNICVNKNNTEAGETYRLTLNLNSTVELVLRLHIGMKAC